MAGRRSGAVMGAVTAAGLALVAAGSPARVEGPAALVCPGPVVVTLLDWPPGAGATTPDDAAQALLAEPAVRAVTVLPGAGGPAGGTPEGGAPAGGSTSGPVTYLLVRAGRTVGDATVQRSAGRYVVERYRLCR